MAKRSPSRLLLIVTGSTLRAEEKDRPLAYYLKQRIENRLDDEEAPDAVKETDDPAGLHGIYVRVVADFRWIHDDLLQRLPTISLGGPGVNALAHRWLEGVPISLAVNDRYFIQMDPDLDEARVSIWGMDNASTQIAVSVFADRFLPDFLDRCAALPPVSLESDGDDGDDDDDGGEERFEEEGIEGREADDDPDEDS